MALTEKIEYDKIEIVTKFKHVQVRRATVIEKDGVEVGRSFHRECLYSGILVDGYWVEKDLSSYPNEITAICNAVWTPEVKQLWKDEVVNNSLQARFAS